MIRLPLVLLALMSSPALAHPAREIHVHETDHMTLIMGLTLIVSALAAAVAIRNRNK
ncbi:MAG: hypothetical protein ABJH07_01505 [Sedimentitalea sp.]|uniref:hypothetical protein n=1 Tax=Sedimentitalea sp. TaxID=2048915 RepID=UPI0032637494